MSRNYKFTLKSPEGTLECIRERRKKKKVAVSSGVDELVEAVSRDPTSEACKEKRPSDDEDGAGKSIHLSFPSNACAHSDLHPHRHEISKLLWPEDRKVLEGLRGDAPASAVDHLLIGLQGAIYMSEKIQGLEKSLKELQAEQEGLKAELDALMVAKKDLERIKEELQAQLDKERQDSSCMKSMIAKIESLEATIVDLTEKLDLIGCEGEILARAEMAREYEAGKAGSWDLAAIYAAYDELMAKRADEAAQIDDLATSVAGMGSQGSRVM